MAFERLLRLTKKCPGYVVSGLRNAGVGFIPARVLISTRVRHRVCRDCDVSTAYLSTEYYIPLLHWSEFICCPIILPVGPRKQLITSIE